MRFKHLNSAVVYNSVNLPPEISGIQSAYTLTQGQNTVITASATDPEGDAITWSFEEVKSGSSYVFVSAPGEDDAGSNSGALYVYSPDDISASPIKLTAPDGGFAHNFGNPAVSNDKLIVGARGHGSETGAIYIFDTSDLNAAPTKILPPTGFSQELFGWKVFGFDDYFTVTSQGSEFSVYLYDTNNLSAEPVQLVQHDEDGDMFGHTVAMNSTHIFVTADRDAGPNNENAAGSVYVFDKSNPTVQATKMLSPSMASGEEFGTSLACDDDVLVISRYGATGNGGIFVYDANDLSSPTFTTSGVAGDSIGYETIVLTEDKIFVGAGFKDNHGAVYIYNKDNPASDFPVVLTPSDGADWDRFGQTLAVTDTKLFVGAQGDDDQGASSGSMYVYDLSDLSAEPTKILHPSGTAGDAFAQSMASIIPSSALNDVTVTQSDNVFTITPGTTDSNFTLRFKVTDAAGNVTTKTSTFAYDYVNKAPTVSGIVSEYNLTQGQDTVITASATDPEGDAITWSFEEVKSSLFFAADDYMNVYDPNTLQLLHSLGPFQSNLGTMIGSMAVGGGKYAVGDGIQTNSQILVYDINDLTATPTTLTDSSDNGFGKSIALSDDKLYVGMYKNNNRAGGVLVYDLNDLSASPTEITSPYSYPIYGEFGDDNLEVAGNKVFISQKRGQNSEGVIYVYDNDDLSAAPIEVRAPGSDSFNGDGFGWEGRFAVSDTHLIVGQIYGGSPTHSGLVHIYDINDLSAAPKTIQPFDATTNGYFGYTVEISNDYIVVGARNGNTAIESFYTYNMSDISVAGTTYNTTVTKIETPETGGERFGKSIRIIENQIFVSLEMGDTNGTNTGSVYVYDATDLTATPQEIVGSREYANFANSMMAYKAPSALNGVTVTQSDNVFTVTPGTSDANFQLRITATDSEGNATSVTPTFGYTVPVPVVNDTSVGRIIAAASNNNYSNKIYAFDLDGSNEKELFIPAGMDNDSQFGADENMAIDGTILVVGQRTEQRVFVYDLATTNEPIEITPSAPSNLYGTSVAISDGKIIVGTYEGASTVGAFYIYDLDGSNEIKVTEPSAGLPGAGSQNGWTKFGWKVAAGHGRIVVGAPMADADGVQDSGQVYIYDMQGTFINTISATDGQTESDQFGDYEIAIGNGKIAVTAFIADGGSINSFTGSVYLYDLDGSNEIRLYDPALTNVARFGTGLAIGHEKVVVGSDNGAHFYIFDLDGSNMQKIASTGNTRISVANNRIVVGDYGKTVSETASGELRVYDMSGNLLNTIHQSNPTNRAFLGSSLAMYDTADARAHNFAPTVSGIDAAYTLTQGQDTVITAAATDPEGDAITWSYEEIMSGGGSQSALNGVTVTQSDNVFTVTPGTADANFQLRITATDSEGNATSVTSDFDFTYVNQAPSVAGIDAAYTLTQGQDTVITAAATDPEGDAVTWSFEEVASGSSGLLVWDISNPYFYDPATMTSPSGLNGALGRNGNHMDETYIYTGNGNHDGVGAIALHPLSDVSASPTILKAPSPTSGETFGTATSSNDDYIFVGARTGAKVYVFNKSDLSHHTTLSATDSSSRFGVSLSVNDTYLFVGADGDDDVGENAGAVYVYDLATFTEQTKLLNPRGDSYFGNIIKSTNSKLLINLRNSDTGRVFVYDTSDFSTTPVELEPVAPYTSEEDFGMDIAVSTKHDKLFVCHRNVNDAVSGNAYGGAVYVYDLNNLSVTPEKILIEDSTQYFGEEMAVVGDTIWIASLTGDSNSAIYGYDITDLDATPTIVQASGGQWFGLTMSSTFPASALNGVTIAQSDNVFTVTPAQQDANFTLKFSATDTAGNATSVTSDFTLDYVNQAPSVTGIDAAYTLTQGQDTVITAAATDPEGDAITWSFEEAFNTQQQKYVYISSNENSFTGAVHVYDADDLSSPITKLVGTGMGPNDYFGRAVAHVGNTLVIGSGSDENGVNSVGSIFVYNTDDLTVAPTKITPPAPFTAYDQFATGIAISSDNIFVGMPYVDETNTNSGTVLVYDKNDLSVAPTHLKPSDLQQNSYYGYHLEITGNYLVASASGTPQGAEVRHGAIYVYDLTDLSAAPTKLSPAETSNADQFGERIAVTSSYILASSVNHGTQGGAVWAYNINDLSSAPTKIEVNGVSGDQFGFRVSANDSVIAVSAALEDDVVTNSGSVYVYDASNLSAAPIKLNEPTAEQHAMFGRSLLVTDDKLLVGAIVSTQYPASSGEVFVYDLSDLNAAPVIYRGTTANEFFGTMLSVTSVPAPQSQLNGVTITQSDNVFTVTPAQQDANFTLRFSATDTAGNVTSTTSDFTLDYVNQAPTVSGIDAAYTLTQGQDTVITAAATDPEGDAIAWSFEEVLGSGDGYVAVTNYNDDDTGTNTGSVYIYNTNDLSAQPVQLTSTEVDDNGRMGETDVVFGAGKVIVGARRDSGHDGAVYVYDLSDLSATPTRLTGPANTEARFGRSVAVHSTNLIVGAEWDPTAGYRAGRVYVYDLNDLSASPTTIVPVDSRESAHFGSSVTVSGDLLFIGSPYGEPLSSSQAAGAVYVYNANDFSLIKKINSSNMQVGDDFGGGTVDSNCVSVSGNNLIVGSAGRNTQRGGVYVFTLDDLNATPTELTAFDGSSGDYFGVSVASTSEHIIVGASGHNANTTNDGAIYIYDINDLSAQPTKIDSPETTQYAGFGKSVSATEDQIFVGTPNYDTYVYSTSDLSLIQTLPKPADVVSNDGFAQVVVAHTLPPVSALNGSTVTQSDNVFTVTPAQQDATFTLAFKATDSEGNVTSTTSDFDFTYVNQAPSLSGIEPVYTLTQGVNEVIVPVVSDVEGETVTMSYEEILGEGVPSGMNGTTVTQNGNDFTVTPGQQDANFTLRFTATDESGNQTHFDSEFTLDYNEAPTITGVDSSYTLDQGQDTQITVTTSDSDGDTVSLTYAVTSGDLSGTTVTQADNVFTITPGNQDATFQLTFTATDPNGAATSVSSDITFDYNAPPVVMGIEAVYTLTTGEDEVIVGIATDADGDSTTWSYEEVLANGVPSGLNGTTIAQNGDVFTITPGSADANFTLRFTATDSAGNVTSTDADFSHTYVAPAPAEYLLAGTMWSEGTGVGSVKTFDTSGTLLQSVATPGNISFGYANFGRNVATNGVKMAVGAPAEQDGGVANHGEITIFNIDGSNPISVIYEDGREANSGDEVGDALAMSDNYMYAGVSKAEQYGGSGSGIVAIYDHNGNLQSTKTAPNANAWNGANQFFGYQVGWTGSRMVASAPQAFNESGSYWDCYFRVYEEDGTFVEHVALPNSKGDRFGEKMDVTGPECTSNKVVLSCKDNNVYVYDLDAADIAGSQVAIPVGFVAWNVAINDSYVYVGNGSSDVVKVYDHSGTFQFDIVPTSDVLTALGETTASMSFGANIEATNHHLAIVTGTNGKIVIYDTQGNNPVPFDTLGGSYGAYWSGGMQFYQ